MSPLALSLHFLQAQPDSRLVTLAREGHAPAFEALVRRYRKELLGYCRRLQPRSGSAEDAVQQTLLQAWKALSAGAEVRDVRPWLYRIAHNVTLNQLRVAGSVPQDVSEAPGGQEIHQLVEQRLQARAALAGMASLPDLQRQVFVSTTLDGATHEEVASALGLSSGAVRGLIYRARVTLRSAAAALIPNPALHWALRRVEARVGGTQAVSEVLAGGGGAGVAAAIAKGGAVLTLAGAVVGAGGAILTHSPNHHRRPGARSADSTPRAQAHLPAARFRDAVDELGSGFAPGVAAGNSDNERQLVHTERHDSTERRQESGSAGGDHGGSGGDSTGERSQGGSDSGSSTSSSDSSDGGSANGATMASSTDGGGSSSSGETSGGSDAGSSGSSGTSTTTTTTSGSDGGTSGGGGSSDGGQITTVQTTTDGSSGSDGGGTASSSGSGDTTTTPTTSTTGTTD
jgi:RNA polymerase sigma factor (sigma-70 family)